MQTYPVDHPHFDNIEYEVRLTDTMYGRQVWRVIMLLADGTERETPRMFGSEQEATENIGAEMDFQIRFWSMQLADRENAVVANRTHYRLGDETSAFRGFGGRTWTFRNLDTGEVVTNSDVWYQGIIPKFADKAFPDTHEIL